MSRSSRVHCCLKNVVYPVLVLKKLCMVSKNHLNCLNNCTMFEICWKMSHFNFSILPFFTIFCPMYWTSYWQVSTDKVSDNTFWPLHTVWNLPKMSHFNFGIFSHFSPLKMTTLVTLFQNGPFFSFLKQPFVHSKCKSCSLCSQITILNESFFCDFQLCVFYQLLPFIGNGKIANMHSRG